MTTKSARMHVDISNLLHQDEGSRVDYEVAGETPNLTDVVLTSPLQGHISFVLHDEGVSLEGRLKAEVELDCHRCLRMYKHSIEFPVRAEFASHPSVDQFSIDGKGQVDIADAVRQELLVHLPVKQLCAEDCAGITLHSNKK